MTWFKSELRAGWQNGENFRCQRSRLRIEHGLRSWVQAGPQFGLDGLVCSCLMLCVATLACDQLLCWGLLRRLSALGAWRCLEPQIAQEGCDMLQALDSRKARIASAELL